MHQPPELVKLLMEAVCIVLGLSPDWNTAHWLLAQPHFVHLLMNIDVNNLPVKAMDKIIQFYFKNPLLTPEYMMKQSIAASHICEWLHGLVMYYSLMRSIQEMRPGYDLQSQTKSKGKIKSKAHKSIEAKIPVEEKKLKEKRIMGKSEKSKRSKSTVNFETPTASSVLKKQSTGNANPLSTLLRR